MKKDVGKKWNWDLFDGSASAEAKKFDREVGDGTLEKLNELLTRATPMIEQVNAQYNQFRSGVEKRPPNERRMQLDSIMNSIQLMPKPSASIRFYIRHIVSKYMTYKDRWDRIMQAKEKGLDLKNLHKIKKSYKRPTAA